MSAAPMNSAISFRTDKAVVKDHLRFHSHFLG